MIDTVRYNAVTREGKQIYEHHTILPPKPGYVVDHINGNGKDNRPENLRYLTNAQNCLKRFNPEAGIDYMKNKKKWRVRVSGTHIGVFKTKKEAIEARQVALKRWLT